MCGIASENTQKWAGHCLEGMPSRSMHSAAGKGVVFLQGSSKTDVGVTSLGQDKVSSVMLIYHKHLFKVFQETHPAQAGGPLH